MAIGLFVDKEHQPTTQELCECLGSRYALWEALTQFIADNYALPGEWTFGGKNYGWNIWYRKSGKTLITLYPKPNGFVAQIVLGKAHVEQALALKLHKNVARVLNETAQLHDGRWLFIPVQGPQDVRDIQHLLQVKRRPKAHKGSLPNIM